MCGGPAPSGLGLGVLEIRGAYGRAAGAESMPREPGSGGPGAEPDGPGGLACRAAGQRRPSLCHSGHPAWSVWRPQRHSLPAPNPSPGPWAGCQSLENSPHPHPGSQDRDLLRGAPFSPSLPGTQAGQSACSVARSFRPARG